MKCRINAPEFITLRDDDDLSFKVRFDYDPGEEQCDYDDRRLER